MKFRHTAALAFVGWYLMMPPLKNDQYGHPLADQSAPLSKWQHAEFRTYDDCEHERKKEYANWFGTKGHPGLVDRLKISSNALDKWTSIVEMEKCIPSDDPRLKPN
jgi:hypothetical protein